MTFVPSYDYSYSSGDALTGGIAGFLLVFLLLVYLLLLAYCVVNYVLFSLSIYKIARRRGIYHPWLAWVPVGNAWVLGSISDQYQYVTKNRVRSRRKVLMGLSIGLYAVSAAVSAGWIWLFSNRATESTAGDVVFGATVGLILLAYVAICVLAVVMLVFEYMALYDLFKSCEPGNAVLYLVLSIVLGVVLPFFLFACRNRDLGMPPRKPVRPAYTAAEPLAESFSEEIAE